MNTLSLAEKRRKMATKSHDASKPSKPSHDIILGTIRKNGKPVTIALMSGAELIGSITQFDKWTITIKDNQEVLITVYKHAVEFFYVDEDNA